MNNTLLDTVAACSKDLMKFGFSVEEFANGFYIVFAYSSRKKGCEILLFRALLHESFQYYLS